MTHLGSLGKKHDRDAVVFDYFGTDITANDALSDLHYLDFMENAAGIAPTDPRSLGFVKDFARVCLGEDQFDVFWSLALANRQSQEDVFETLTAVLEAASGRPTKQPSDSSDGQQTTATNSEDVSSSLADRLEGRPDLQLVVEKAREAQASQAS